MDTTGFTNVDISFFDGLSCGPHSRKAFHVSIQETIMWFSSSKEPLMYIVHNFTYMKGVDYEAEIIQI